MNKIFLSTLAATTAALPLAAEEAAKAAEPAAAAAAAAATKAASVSAEMFTINNLWILLGAVLVFAMHPGFALVETGLSRAKNSVNILAKNVITVAIGLITYLIIGFNLMYPGDNWILGRRRRRNRIQRRALLLLDRLHLPRNVRRYRCDYRIRRSCRAH